MKLKEPRFGPTTQKILLLLQAGIVLALTQRPDYAFRVIQGTAKEWQKINRRALHEAIRKLYQSKLVDYKENNDGTVALTLTDSGIKRSLRYNLDTIKIETPKYWDKLWRIAMFDIPEFQKAGRNALAEKLKELGFYPIQKSVFIYPYPCKNEIDFIVEIFQLTPFVRFIVARETDVDIHLKAHFGL